MAVTQLVVNQQAGPLPITTQFQALGDGAIDVFLSGTGYNIQAGPCGIEMWITDQGGTQVGYTAAEIYTNEVNQHRTLLAMTRDLNQLKAGEMYNVTIQSISLYFTRTDQNDFFTATIVY